MTLYYVTSKNGMLLGTADASTKEQAIAIVRRKVDEKVVNDLNGVPQQLRLRQQRDHEVAQEFEGACATLQPVPPTPAHTRRYLGSANIDVGRLLDMLNSHLIHGGSPKDEVFLELYDDHNFTTLTQRIALVTVEGAPAAVYLRGPRKEDW